MIKIEVSGAIDTDQKCRNVAPGRGAVTELPVRKSTRVHQ